MAAVEPPSKREQLLRLFELGSVFVHVDPRRDGVMVPPWLTRQAQLVLQLGLNFPVPIRDLEIDDDGVRCTLSFNRAPHYCVLPWSAVYALVGEDNQVTVWPSELPPELVPQLQPAVRRDGPRARRSHGSSAAAASTTGDDSLPPAPARPRLKSVKDGDGASASTDARESDGHTNGDAPRTPKRPAPALVPVPGSTPEQRPSRPNHLRLVK